MEYCFVFATGPRRMWRRFAMGEGVAVSNEARFDENRKGNFLVAEILFGAPQMSWVSRSKSGRDDGIM